MEISGVMRYCSEIPLSQYPDVVQLDITGTEAVPKLLEMTDGLTIDLLKSLHELNRIHISEFIRRLAVSFLVESTDAQFTSLQQLLHALTTDLGGHRKELQSCLDAHRHSSVSSVMCDTEMTKWRPPASASHLQQSYQAVHSLELHLLAALKKIQDIGKTMEKNVDKISSLAQEDKAATQAGEIDQSQKEHWNGLLNLVRAELNACLGCLEEGVHHLEGKSSTNENAGSLTISQAQPEKKTSGAKVLKVSADDDPVIKDEVFEGYSEPQEYGTRGDVSDVTSAEEEAWRKKRKRALKMCLSELGAIIAVRAADRQERERTALERMKRGTHNVETDEGATGCRFQSGEREGLDRVKKRTPDAVQVGAEMGLRFSGDDQEDCERMTKGTLNAVNERGQMEHGFLGDEEKDVEMNIYDVTRREAGSVCLGEGDDKSSADERADVSDCSTDVQESLTVFRNNESVQQNVCIEKDSMEKLEQTVNSSLDQPAFPRAQLEVDCEANIRSVQESSRLDSELSVDDVSKTLASKSGTGASAEPPPACMSGVTAASANSQSSTTVRQSVILDLTAEGCKVQNHRPAHNTDLISKDLSHNAAPVLDLSHESVSSEDSDSDFDQRIHKSSHRRHPQYRSKPENIEEHLSLPAAPSPFACSVASMVASRARNLTHAVETFGDSASDTDEQDVNNCDGGIIR